MAATEEILGQFLGDEAFPVTWDSDVEKDFFWVYDDLHCPHPVSPMFFDIGGWWLSCDHMFRRFGTPFAVDWLAKNVNGYVYTTAIPADPGPAHRGHRVQLALRGPRAARRVIRDEHGRLPRHRPARVWRALRRLVARPARARDAAQLRLSRGAPRRGRRDGPGRDRGAPRGRDRHPRSPLEDPLDAQLRPAVGDAEPAGGDGEAPRRGRRAVARTPPELRLRPELGLDRGALADEERGPRRRRAADRVRRRRGPRDRPATCGRRSAAGGSSPSASSPTSASSAGTPSGATNSSSRRSASRWSRPSSWSAATSRPTTTSRRRSRRCARTSKPRRARSSRG